MSHEESWLITFDSYVFCVKSIHVENLAFTGPKMNFPLLEQPKDWAGVTFPVLFPYRGQMILPPHILQQLIASRVLLSLLY